MDNIIENLISKSEVILITGRRGSGKTALGAKLLENSGDRDAYFMGLSESYWNLLPDNITPLLVNTQTLENLPSDAVIFMDEAGLFYFSRDYSKQLNKLIAKLVTEARHLNQVLVFATHTLRKLDVSIVLDADAILLKEPSLLHSKFERKEILELVRQAKHAFDKISPPERVKHAYLVSQDYEGMLEVELPSFWTEELSHAVASVIESNKSLNNNSSFTFNMTETEEKKKLKQTLEELHPEIRITKIQCTDYVGINAVIKPEFEELYTKKRLHIVASKKLEEIEAKLTEALKEMEEESEELKIKHPFIDDTEILIKETQEKAVVICAMENRIAIKGTTEDPKWRWFSIDEIEKIG